MPDGGVLVFDEISNMGENSLSTRDALFKRLYHPFEEGRWTSSATGETYDLSKYVIVLTGNDGEDYFKGTDSDEIREQIWRKLKAPDKVRRMLGERGVPQAFLGRMADVILFKPLTHAIARDVAAKLVGGDPRSLRRARDRGPRRRVVLSDFRRPLLHRRQGRAQPARRGDPPTQPRHRQRAVASRLRAGGVARPLGAPAARRSAFRIGRSSGRTIRSRRSSSSSRSARREATRRASS